MLSAALLSEAATVTEIARLGSRLTAEQIAQVRGVVDTLFRPLAADPVEIDATTRPPLTAGEIAASGIPPSGSAPHDLAATEPLTAEQIRAALVEGMRRPAIESWMAMLDPEQARIVHRTFTGPVRIRGAAGTGKTVVALHRAAHIARVTGARVLVTTYVRTLPKVMEGELDELLDALIAEDQAARLAALEDDFS